jgi:hypothetical protein
MSHVPNISGPRGLNSSPGTGDAASEPDIPLDNLQSPNTSPISHGTQHNAPDRSPEALDERLYDDLCKGV